MSTVFDRINAELEQVGHRIRTALEESRLRAEKAGVVARRSRAAYRLGLLVHARERGTEPEPGAYEALLTRMDELTAQIADLDRKIAAEEGEVASVHDDPPPPADPADAEIR